MGALIPDRADITVEVHLSLNATWPTNTTHAIHETRSPFRVGYDLLGRVRSVSSRVWHIYFDGQNTISLRLVQKRKKEYVYAAVAALSYLLQSILIERGLTILHASAITIGERAFVIVGNSGSGKSTLAGCLAAMGAGFICDDAAVLEPRDGLPFVSASLEGPLISALIGTARLVATCCRSDIMRGMLKKVLSEYPHVATSDWETPIQSMDTHGGTGRH